MMQQVSEVKNIAETPSFRWKSRLLGLLINQIPNAALVVGRMKVDINQNFAGDEELFEPSLELYSRQIVAMWDQVKKLPLSTHDQAVFFVESVKDLSLTYNG